MVAMTGGERIGEILERQGVPFLFTLCGGHISPILVGAKARGVRVVDVRHEATAVFAADAAARLTGVPGVAVVTAGPGLTNALTAVKNAQLAQSPVIVLGGATATALKGRGALQDIDQTALLRPHVKFLASVRRLRDLGPALLDAFRAVQEGAPGPAVVECPADLLYPEPQVSEWYGLNRPPEAGAGGRLMRGYLRWHVSRLFAGAENAVLPDRPSPRVPDPGDALVRRASKLLAGAERPVLLLGSQATLLTREIHRLQQAVARLGAPVYLSGMARGLLGRDHPLVLRHRRAAALHEADLVLLAGVPCDFRLEYGRQINPRAKVIAVNRSRADLRKNRRPTLGVHADPSRFVQRLAEVSSPARWDRWIAALVQRDAERSAEIRALAEKETEYINPLDLCRAIDAHLADDSVVVADGGDFVATASYIVSPGGPLSWLDPGPFGTLGVGAGFALGAKLCRPEAEVWILYGDGSAAFSLAEFDTFVRHGLPVIAVVGNDACWTQIAREQVRILGDDVGTVLRRTAYDRVAEGYGGRGCRIERPDEIPDALAAAKAAARAGSPVLVNAMIGKTGFRAGSISL